MSRRLASSTAVSVVSLAALAAAAPAGSAEDSFRCRVSTLGHPVPGRPPFTFGNARIAVVLPPRATFVARPDNEPGWAWVQEDGWIRTKLGWWTARGKPRVTGRRLDRITRSLRADIGSVASDGTGPFYPSLLYFPSAGCWKITATAGGAKLVAVVWVVKR